MQRKPFFANYQGKTGTISFQLLAKRDFMNRGKQPLSKTMGKKVQKDVKKTIREIRNGPKSTSEKETLSSILKKQPSKKATIEKHHLDSLERSMQRKKAKASTKQSKRSSPRDAIVNSEPDHIHAEGTRWIKTLSKQQKATRIISTKHSSKLK